MGYYLGRFPRFRSRIRRCTPWNLHHLDVPDRLKDVTHLDYVGDTLGTSQHTGENAIYDLASYHKIDLSTQWQIQSNLKLDFYLQNVLDKDYQQAVGVPGAELGAGAKVSWIFE